MKIKRNDKSDVAVKIVTYVFCIFFAIICIYPFYYIIINSVSGATAVLKGVYFWPQDLTFINYQKFFEGSDIVQAFFISVLRTALGTALTIACCSFLAYLFTKKEMLFRTFLYRALVCTMYLSAGLIPWYITMRTYHLQNSFLLYVLPSAINAYYIVLLKTYFEQLPAELEESAMLDGAGLFTIFGRIIIPLSKPIIATVSLFSAVTQWNSWQDAYFLVTERSLKPLQLVLYNYLNEAERLAQSMRSGATASVAKMLSPESIRMAAIVITVIPILLVYPSLQKFFAKGIMMGAVKG